MPQMILDARFHAGLPESPAEPPVWRSMLPCLAVRSAQLSSNFREDRHTLVGQSVSSLRFMLDYISSIFPSFHERWPSSP